MADEKQRVTVYSLRKKVLMKKALEELRVRELTAKDQRHVAELLTALDRAIDVQREELLGE